MIQTEYIKKFVKKMPTLRQNIIKLYRVIWGQYSPSLQRELEGDPEYITKSPTYNFLWLFTWFKMRTSGIDHIANSYYSKVMAMRTILCLIQGRYEPTEEYYRQFEASISTDELEKCNATTHI